MPSAFRPNLLKGVNDIEPSFSAITASTVAQIHGENLKSLIQTPPPPPKKKKLYKNKKDKNCLYKGLKTRTKYGSPYISRAAPLLSNSKYICMLKCNQELSIAKSSRNLWVPPKRVTWLNCNRSLEHEPMMEMSEQKTLSSSCNCQPFTRSHPHQNNTVVVLEFFNISSFWSPKHSSSIYYIRLISKSAVDMFYTFFLCELM